MPNQKAIQQLAAVARQLSSSKSSRAARAVTAIQNAEKELQTALTIK